MLQTDPKKRITIQELCNHPWVTAGFLNPVSFVHKTNVYIFTVMYLYVILILISISKYICSLKKMMMY